MTNKKQVIVTSVILLLSLIILYPSTILAQDVVPEYVVTIRFHSYYLETDDIPILSFEFSEQNTAAGEIKKSSMVEMADILVTRLVDENSPKLFVECAKGSILDEAFISIWYPGSIDTYPDVQVWLRQVSVSS